MLIAGARECESRAAAAIFLRLSGSCRPFVQFPRSYDLSPFFLIFSFTLCSLPGSPPFSLLSPSPFLRYSSADGTWPMPVWYKVFKVQSTKSRQGKKLKMIFGFLLQASGFFFLSLVWLNLTEHFNRFKLTAHLCIINLHCLSTSFYRL